MPVIEYGRAFLSWLLRKNKIRNTKYDQIIEGLESQSEKVGVLFNQSFQKYLLRVTVCQT